MRIIIDMQGLQTKFSAHRGVGRYTENIVKYLLKHNDKHEFYLALNGALEDSIDGIREKFAHSIDDDHIIVWQQHFETAAKAENTSSSKKAGEIIREVYLNSFEPDIIFSTNLQEGLFEPSVTSVNNLNYSTNYCTTLHDLVPFFYQEDYLKDPVVKEWYYEKIEHAKKSDILLTVSYSSKQDIVEKLHIEEDKVHVIENGYDEEEFNATPATEKQIESIKKKYDLKKPFIFYVGGNDKHKNIARLIEAYSFLPESLREKNHLLLAGREFKSDETTRNLAVRFGISDQVITPGFVDDIDLPLLLKTCACFVFPSTHEGFGLPALEAMASGAPVIGSNSSSIQEIIGNRDALFDPNDAADIAKKLALVLEDDNYRQSLVSKGLDQAKNYSWDKSAKALLVLFENVKNTKAQKRYSFGDPVEKAINAISLLEPALPQEKYMDVAKSIAETFPAFSKKTVYLDVSSVVAFDYRSGIQRVTRAISGAFASMDLQNLDVALVYTDTKDLNFYRANAYMRDVFDSKVSPHDTYVEFKAGDILVFLDLHPSVAIAHKKYTKHLRNRGVKVYHVIYDILPIIKPETFWPELCNEFKEWIEAVSNSDGAICISKAVANEVKDYLVLHGEVRATPFKIGWFHLGADIENSAPTLGVGDSAHSLVKDLKSRPTFLMVGTLEPRKGHKQTLKAFQELWNAGYDINLVMIGRLGWGMAEFEPIILNDKNYGKRLFWLSSISDEYLKEVYQYSNCLISPSEGEGFGLPLIEAARYEIPIIARDIPVFKEVAGENAYYFDDNKDHLTIASCIKNWLKLFESGSHPKSTEMPWLTWDQSAEQFSNVLLEDDWLYKIHCQGALSTGSKENHNSKRVKWKNFSGAESDFRWTSGDKSAIEFKWADTSNNCTVAIACNSFGTQRFSLLLNKNIVFSGVIDGQNQRIISDLPDLIQGNNTLELILPDAKKPGGGDTRTLALAIKGIEFFSLQPLQVNKAENHRSTNVSWKNFSNAEDHIRWTAKKECIIGFRWKDSLSNKKVRILLDAFRTQLVTIFLNENKVYTSKISGDDQEIYCPLNGLKNGYNELKFVLPDAVSPGNGDERILSLAIRQIEIV